MPTIFDRVPISTRDELAFLRNERVTVKAYEVLIWVSLKTEAALSWEPGVPVFPAILDTAHTHNFSLQRQHLIRWAGLHPEQLDQIGHIRHSGQRVPIYAADVWIHRNQRGERDRLTGSAPFRLALSRGIAVHADESRYPRLPVLGLRALITNRLDLAISGSHSFATLRTPRRFWFFG